MTPGSLWIRMLRNLPRAAAARYAQPLRARFPGMDPSHIASFETALHGKLERVLRVESATTLDDLRWHALSPARQDDWIRKSLALDGTSSVRWDVRLERCDQIERDEQLAAMFNKHGIVADEYARIVFAWWHESIGSEQAREWQVTVRTCTPHLWIALEQRW